MTLDYTKIDKKYHLYDKQMDEKNKSFVYGEVDYLPFVTLLKDDNVSFYPGDTFIDIGSGCGKFVSGIAVQQYFKEMYFHGIEIHNARFNQSITLQDELDIHANTEFMKEDFRNIYFGNYNVLYCCNTIFGEEENNILFDKINEEFNGYFILFEYDNVLKPYFIKEMNVRTSWNKNVPVYIFHK